MRACTPECSVILSYDIMETMVSEIPFLKAMI